MSGGGVSCSDSSLSAGAGADRGGDCSGLVLPMATKWLVYRMLGIDVAIFCCLNMVQGPCVPVFIPIDYTRNSIAYHRLISSALAY